MAIPQALLEALKGNESKVGDKSVLDYVVDLFDYNEKLKGINTDLTGQRDVWKSKEADFNTKIEGLTSGNEELNKKLLGLGEVKNNTSELEKLLEAERNTSKQSIEELNTKIDSILEANKQAAQAKHDTAKQLAESNLFNEITTALTGEKITGRNLELALMEAKQKGWAAVNEIDGKFEPAIIVNQDNKNVSMDVNGFAKHIAQNNQSWVDASGNKGTGETHQAKQTVNLNNGVVAGSPEHLDSMYTAAFQN